MQFLGSILLLLSTVYGANIRVRDYHRDIGIPLANKLKQIEGEIYGKGLSNGRISGGSLIDISKIPHQAGIVIEVPSSVLSFCGGAVISSTRVLTAAHCQLQGAVYTVALGSNFVFHGGHRVNATNFIPHSGYSPDDWTFIHDIAMVHMPTISFTDLIQPIALPDVEDVSNNFAGHTAIASGYGVTPDTPNISLNQTLRAVSVQVITPSECGAIYGATGSRNESICTSGTNGVGICDSDSGGPLMTVNNDTEILIGLTSFGTGCGLSFPSGYVRITQYLDWISST